MRPLGDSRQHMQDDVRVYGGVLALDQLETIRLAAAPPPAPLLHYTFDEPSGDALDSGSAPAAPGQLLDGATRSANTPSGQGFALDFTNDNPYAHLLEGDANKLDGLSQITLTTWLNVSDYTRGNARLMSKQSAGAFGGFSWNMNATPNDGDVGPDNFRLGLFLGNNISSGGTDFGFAFSSADVETAANNWVYLAVTYDGSTDFDNIKFYIGGVNTSVVPLGDPQSIIALTLDGGDSRFGVGFTDAAPTADTSVIGFQDDVRVYGSVLALSQLDAIRQANLAVAPARPALEISRSGQQVIISWPASATGFTLETASNLVSPTWSPVTQEVQTVGDRSTVTINPTDTTAFYRLRKP